MSACEALPAGLPRQLDHSASVDRRWRRWLQEPYSADSNELGDFWAAAVRTYTRCDLKFTSDKLLAIWGVAQLVRDAQAEEWGQWGAGLWSNSLAQSLMWKVSGYERAKRPGSMGTERVPPSWSWASVIGAIDLSDSWVEEPFYTVANHNGDDICFQSSKGNGDKKSKDPFAIACDSIKMKCHLGTGSLGQVEGQKELTLFLNQRPLFRAFPDTNLANNEVYEFLILSASKESEMVLQDVAKWVDGGAFGNNETIMRHTFSGFGLLIHPVEKTGGADSSLYGNMVDEITTKVYSRIGVFEFSQISEEDWQQVRLACGSDADTELAVERGSLIELI